MATHARHIHGILLLAITMTTVCGSNTATRSKTNIAMLCLSDAHGGSGVVGQWRQRWKELGIWCALALLAAVWTLRAHETHKHTLVRPIRAGARIRWAARYLASQQASPNKQGQFKYLARANGRGPLPALRRRTSCLAVSFSLVQSFARSLKGSFSFSLCACTLFLSEAG